MKNDLLRIDGGCTARAVDADKRRVRFLAQSAALASDKLVILPYAGRKYNKEFMKNPIVTPYHMRQSFEGGPIVAGHVVEDGTEWNDEGMFQTVEFGEHDLGEQYWILYRDGHMRMVSIAWDSNDDRETDPKKMLKVLEKENIQLKDEEKVELRGVVRNYRQRDLSLVAIGADPKALARSADGGNEVAVGIMEFYREEDGGLFLPSDNLAADPPPVQDTTEEIRVNTQTLQDMIDKAFDAMSAHISQKVEDLILRVNNTETSLPDGDDNADPPIDPSGQDEPGKESRLATVYDAVLKFDERKVKRNRPDYGKVLDKVKPNKTEENK